MLTSDDLVQCGAWMALDATSPDGNGRALIRQDMVDVAFDTLSLRSNGCSWMRRVNEPWSMSSNRT